jgi:hypothetical protein
MNGMRWWFLLSLGMLSAAPALEADPLPFPCQFADYRVKNPLLIYLYCNIRVDRKLNFAVSIAEVDDQDQRIPGTTRSALLTLDPGIDTHWAKVDISAMPLQEEKTYQLFTNRQYDGVDYDVATFSFDTKATASVVIPIGTAHVDGRLKFALISKIELDSGSLPAGTLTEDFGVIHQPLHATFTPLTLDVPSPMTIGIAQILVDPPGPKSLKTHLTVRNIQNIFQKPVQVPPKYVIALPGGPKDKDSADLYLKFLNQAGPGSKPGWAADIKFAPQLANLGGGFFLMPSVLADFGLGTVEDNKVTDMIKAGAGVTKFWSAAHVQLTPQVQFETDREGHHQNLLFDGDVQYFGHGWLNSIKDKNQRKLAAASLQNLIAGKKIPSADTIPSATWGWQIQAFLGTELGGAISSDTVQSSDKATMVVLPTYSVARLRPRLAATLEYRFVTLNITVTPRYLFATETGTREQQIPSPTDVTKQIANISLHTIRGFRPYGEAGIAFQFVEAGHYAISTTYKLGSLPPNFDYVNTVQTGLVVKF